MPTSARELVLTVVLVAALAEIDTRQIYEHGDWNTTPGNAGVRIRLTKKGINHVKTVGVRLLNEQISKLSGYSTQFPISQPGIEGIVSLSNVRVLHYNPPQISVVNFLPPRFIIFGLENMDIWLAGAFYGSGALFKVDGFVDGGIQGMTVALTAEFAATVDGIMTVQVPNCSTVIGRSHFNINPQGPMGPVVKTLEGSFTLQKELHMTSAAWVVSVGGRYHTNAFYQLQLFHGLINERIRHRIPGMFCTKLKRLIEENSPRLFAKLVRTDFEEHFKSFSLIDSAVIRKFVEDFVKGMYINNLHIQNPIITNDYFETQQRGEIRYSSNSDITPFYPKAMYTSNDSERMLYFYGSEYLFNSLLYHAYQTNKLSIKLNKDNLSEKYRGFVATTCSGKNFTSAFCVGKLIPSIAEGALMDGIVDIDPAQCRAIRQRIDCAGITHRKNSKEWRNEEAYPNTTTSFVLLPHELPDFQFNGDAGAIKLSSRLLTRLLGVSTSCTWFRLQSTPARIITYVDDHGHERQIMVSSAEGQADVLLVAQNGRLSGDLKLNRLSVRLHRSALPNVDPSSIEELTPLAKTFIGPQLSQALKKGIPFPLQDSILFVEPQLVTHDGYIELATDFILNENALRRKIQETFASINA